MKKINLFLAAIFCLSTLPVFARGGMGGGGGGRGGGMGGARGGAPMNVNHNVNVNRNVNVNVHGGGGYGWGGYHPVAAAAVTTAAVFTTAAVIGSVVHSVPPSCVTTVYSSVTYQQCGSTWYQPQMVGSSMQYVVVRAPI